MFSNYQVQDFTYFNETKLLILCSIFLHGTNLLFNCLNKNWKLYDEFSYYDGCFSPQLYLHLHYVNLRLYYRASLVAQLVKNLLAVQESWIWSLGWEDPLEKEMATHSSILAWKIPWTEEPGGLQSMGLQELDTTEQLNQGYIIGICLE